MTQDHTDLDPTITTRKHQILDAALRKFNSERDHEWVLHGAQLYVPSINEVEHACAKRQMNFLPGLELISHRVINDELISVQLLHRHGVRNFVYDLKVVRVGY